MRGGERVEIVGDLYSKERSAGIVLCCNKGSHLCPEGLGGKELGLYWGIGREEDELRCSPGVIL